MIRSHLKMPVLSQCSGLCRENAMCAVLSTLKAEDTCVKIKVRETLTLFMILRLQ